MTTNIGYNVGLNKPNVRRVLIIDLNLSAIEASEKYKNTKYTPELLNETYEW